MRYMDTKSCQGYLEVNWEKSVVLLLNFNGDISACIVHMRILGLEDKHKHLGMSLMFGEENGVIGVEVINRLSRWAADLQILHLSFAGRVVALNFIIESIL